jgi:hypothetical protein
MPPQVGRAGFDAFIGREAFAGWRQRRFTACLDVYERRHRLPLRPLVAGRDRHGP